MRDDLIRAPALLGPLAGVGSLTAGCSAATSGEVQELEPGTYSIAVNRTSSYLAEGDKAIATAVDKAGAHCHAKGQKFMLRSAVGKTVVFRCVPMHPNRQRRKCLNPFLHRRSNNPEAIHFRSANHVQTAFQVLTECRTGPLNEERSI
jgi:hypothetical protein